jgi:hypothetical protein
MLRLFPEKILPCIQLLTSTAKKPGLGPIPAQTSYPGPPHLGKALSSQTPDSDLTTELRLSSLMNSLMHQ